MPVVVYYSISWDMSQIQARHHHVAYQSQGHVCPLHTCTVVCLEGKGGRTLSSSALGLLQDIQCPKEQT